MLFARRLLLKFPHESNNSKQEIDPWKGCTAQDCKNAKILFDSLDETSEDYDKPESMTKLTT